MSRTPCYLDRSLLKLRLGDSATTYDAAYDAALAGVEAAVETYLGYNPAYASVTEYYSTQGQIFIVLKRSPLVSVTSVYQDSGGHYGSVADSFAAETLLVSGEDYAVENEGGRLTGRVYLIGSKWGWDRERFVSSLGDTLSPVRGGVKVTYVAGWQPQTVPSDVADAGLVEAAARWQRRAGVGGPFQSESLNGYSYSRADGTRNVLGESATAPFLTDYLKAALRPYRQPAFGRY